jgi:hypothetical protein
MNKLIRDFFRYDGVFGHFYFDGEEEPFMVTLEHAFPQDSETYFPIIPNGIFTCRRGIHSLHNGIPFETFEVTGIEGHSGLLFHPGNYNKDSEGCILVGTVVTTYDSKGDKMITGSRDKFQEFMKRLDGVNEFQLKVSQKNAYGN